MNNSNEPAFCANCGDETEDWDELPNGRRIYICGKPECQRDFLDTCREMEAEARDRAQDDRYGRYY